MSERDYGKFLTDDGQLNLQLLQPHVQTALVTAYRRDPEVIVAVFDELWFLWDLQQLQSQAGPEADTVALADQIIADMDEGDYLRVRAAFQRRLVESFAEDPQRFAAILDPVYDELEASGWAPAR